jgi:hypothetical protein
MALTPLMAGQLDEGLRGEIKRGNQGGDVAGGDMEKRQRSAGVGKGMELTGGPHMAVTCEREGVYAGVRKVQGNTPFGKYANVA